MNDPHIDVRAPSFRRTDDYLEACFWKLDQVADLCDNLDIDVLCCTGDWFHKKNPQSVPHRVVRRLLQWSMRVTSRRPIFTVLGNHDVQFNDFSPSSIAKQPVGVLLTNPGVRLLGPTDLVEIAGVYFTGSSYRPPVLVDGEPVEDATQFRLGVEIHPGEVVVQLTHASVMPEKPVWKPYLLADELPALTPATICHTGHIHEDLGVHEFTRPDGSTFYWTNVGSLTRGSLSEATIDRQPKVLMVEVSPEQPVPVFTPIILQHRPAEEIYDVTSYREEKAETKAFSAWSSRLREELYAAASEDKSITDLVQELSLIHI